MDDLGGATSFVTTRIVIEVLYFGIITPVGLLRRLVADNPTTPARNEQRLLERTCEGAALEYGAAVLRVFQMNLISELWAYLRERKRVTRAYTSAQAPGGHVAHLCAGLGNSAIRLYDFLVFAEGESILRVMAFAFDGVVCLSMWCLFRQRAIDTNR